MLAKFSGRCCICKEPIIVGESIEPIRPGVARHSGCEYVMTEEEFAAAHQLADRLGFLPPPRPGPAPFEPITRSDEPEFQLKP